MHARYVIPVVYVDTIVAQVWIVTLQDRELLTTSMVQHIPVVAPSVVPIRLTLALIMRIAYHAESPLAQVTL